MVNRFIELSVTDGLMVTSLIKKVRKYGKNVAIKFFGCYKIKFLKWEGKYVAQISYWSVYNCSLHTCNILQNRILIGHLRVAASAKTLVFHKTKFLYPPIIHGFFCSPEVSHKKDSLILKIHRKTLCLESLSNKVSPLRPATLSKDKRLWHRYFAILQSQPTISEFLMTTFSSENTQTTCTSKHFFCLMVCFFLSITTWKIVLFRAAG